MDRELLELLACPKCRGELAESADGSFLSCPRCAIRYPVEDGIPVLLVDRALQDG